MKTNISVKKILEVVLGTFLVSLGIALLVTGTYGVDTISTFLLGIMNFIPIPFWQASISFNVIALLIVWLTDKSELGIGSIINGLGIGVILKFLTSFVALLAGSMPYYSLFAAVVGPLIFGIGCGIYVSADLGAAALEALTNVIYKRVSWSIKAIRIALDAALVVIGLLLGASVGLGTILCVLLIGPTLEWTLKVLSKKRSALLQSKVLDQ